MFTAESVAVGLGVLFVLGARAAWFFTIDDAYITFRHKKTRGHGHLRGH